MNTIRMSAAALLLLLAQLISTSAGADTVGIVIRSLHMPAYPVGTRIEEGTEIVTEAGQKIALQTIEGDVLAVDGKSKVKLVKPGFFSQLFGKVFYFFIPREDQDVTVKTSTATIGIRGTKFIIDSASDDATGGDVAADKVSLVEGKLNFQSNDDETFALYKQRALRE
jgi:hypothetical protein